MRAFHRTFGWFLLWLGASFGSCGEGSGGSDGETSDVPSPSPLLGRLYVTSPSGGEILRFDSAFSVNGDAAPAAVITHTSLKGPRFIFLDVSNDRLYVVSNGSSKILVYDKISAVAGAVNLPPNRIVTSPYLQEPIDVAVDLIRDEMYVSNGTSGNYNILVFSQASTVNGSATPGRILTADFNFPHGVLYDAPHDRLFVADLNNDVVKIFDGAGTKNGSIAATRTITSDTDPGLLQPISLAIDASNNLVVCYRQGNTVRVYANADTVADLGGTPPSPIRTLTGAATTFDHPHQVFHVPGTDELYVADAFAGSVLTFAGYSTATGNLAPTRILRGTHTNLDTIPGPDFAMGCAGIAVDTTR